MTVKEWLKSWNGFTRRKLTDFANQVEEDLSEILTNYPRYIRWGIHHFLPQGCLNTYTAETGAIEWNDDHLHFTTGSTSGSIAAIWKNVDWRHYPQPTWEKKRYLGIGTIIYDYPNQTIYFITGDYNQNTYVGFRLIGTNASGVSRIGESSSEVSLGAVPTGEPLLLEVMFYPTERVEFFIRGEKKGELTTSLPSGTTGANTCVLAGIIGTGAEEKFDLTGLEFLQVG